MCSLHSLDNYYLPRPWAFTWWEILVRLSAVTKKSHRQSKAVARSGCRIIFQTVYAVCGHILATHIPMWEMALPNRFTPGQRWWRSHVLNNQLSILQSSCLSNRVSQSPSTCDRDFDDMTSGPNITTLFPGIVPNISYIPDQNGNEQKLLNAGRIPYPVFTVSASIKRLHELMMNFHGAGYCRSSLWGSHLNSRSTDRYALATSSATLSWWLFFNCWPCMSLRSHWYTPGFCSKDFRGRSCSSRPLIQVDDRGGLHRCEYCTGNHTLLFVSHLDCGDFSEVLVSGPIQTSHPTNLVENYIILLVCGGVYGNNLDLYGQRSLHHLSGLWGPDRYHKFG